MTHYFLIVVSIVMALILPAVWVAFSILQRRDGRKMQEDRWTLK